MNALKEPNISVVLSTYQEPVRYVEEAIESVFAQSISPKEVIVVVDDIGNQLVLEYLAKLEAVEPRLKIIQNVQPRGLAYCRNLGIHQVTGEYVALMDADDVAETDRFRVQYEFLQEKNADVVFSHVTFIDDSGASLDDFKPTTKNPRKDIFAKHVFAHPTAFAKASLFAEEAYDTNFKRAQDIDLWIRLIYSGKKFVVVPQSLLRYRLHRNQSAKKRIERQGAYAQYGFKIARKHFRSQYKNITYWIFTMKWFFYHSLYTLVPIFILIGLVKLKDLLRK